MSNDLDQKRRRAAEQAADTAGYRLGPFCYPGGREHFIAGHIHGGAEWSLEVSRLEAMHAGAADLLAVAVKVLKRIALVPPAEPEARRQWEDLTATNEAVRQRGRVMLREIDGLLANPAVMKNIETRMRAWLAGSWFPPNQPAPPITEDAVFKLRVAYNNLHQARDSVETLKKHIEKQGGTVLTAYIEGSDVTVKLDKDLLMQKLLDEKKLAEDAVLAAGGSLDFVESFAAKGKA